ncbi:MAG TPA: glycosyltransferase family 2 protein [Gemmatimonadaceae bacterium]|nr:glycosyltransferase family 2 protein [Gemmatimonadaceae bacterium]
MSETRPVPPVTVIVMAFNEVASLASVVTEISAALDTMPGGYESEILIVDDGSRDGTGEVADKLAVAHPRISVIHHHVNRGVGEVLRSGFAAARGELVTFLPADGQFPATIVPTFVDAAATADLVVGYVPDLHGARSPVARLLSAGEKLFYRVLFGPLPKFQGIMMFRRALLERFTLTSQGRGWMVLTELMVRCMRSGCTIRSVATPLRPRAAGVSKVNNLRTILANVRQALELRASL